MYKLPEKFTGYNAQEIGVEIFKELCYSLQWLGALKVKEIFGYSYPKNYYRASVEDAEDNFFIYMNCFCRVIGFRNLTEEKEVFFNKPNIESTIANLYPDIVVLSNTELGQSVTRECMDNLNPVDIKKLNYWLPSTVGGVLFSWYFD